MIKTTIKNKINKPKTNTYNITTKNKWNNNK